jgi:hypothetical protein
MSHAAIRKKHVCCEILAQGRLLVRQSLSLFTKKSLHSYTFKYDNKTIRAHRYEMAIINSKAENPSLTDTIEAVRSFCRASC